jgi:hypothetical protein
MISGLLDMIPYDIWALDIFHQNLPAVDLGHSVYGKHPPHNW